MSLNSTEDKQKPDKSVLIGLKYYVGQGNNAKVIKNAMKNRSYWSPASTENFEECNFIWTSWKKEQHITYLKTQNVNELKKNIKIYGRMDNNKQLTNKKGIFLNMKEYYQSQDKNPFDVLPLTFLVKNSSDPQFRNFETYYNKVNLNIKEQNKLMHREIRNYLKKKGKIEESDEEEDDCQDDPDIMRIKSSYKTP